jgi:hypothetical protein
LILEAFERQEALVRQSVVVHVVTHTIVAETRTKSEEAECIFTVRFNHADHAISATACCACKSETRCKLKMDAPGRAY